MVKRRFNIKRFIIVIVLLILIVFFSLAGVFFFYTTPVSSKNKDKVFTVESGELARDVFDNLENEGLIRSALIMKIYDKINGGFNLKAGEYVLNTNMNLIEIYNELKNGGKDNQTTVTITLTEGQNVRDLSSLISENTNISKEEFINAMEDEETLNTLINEYWFLTDEIKNKDIYYSLEGYLYPDTYIFYKDTTPIDIMRKFLNRTEEILDKYKSQIEESGFSVHEILTLASIIEIESYDNNDRLDIAGVFMNRLNAGWSLESCVSTYYAFNINMGERELTMDEIDDCSTKYNTRCRSFVGLPVGPIGNPSENAIYSALNPNKHNYFFFASDKNLKTYFSETNEEHEETVSRLKEEGLWLTYE